METWIWHSKPDTSVPTQDTPGREQSNNTAIVRVTLSLALFNGACAIQQEK